MPPLNFEIDEAKLLRAYRISSLQPSKWEDIDYDFEHTVADSVLSPSTDRDNDSDFLGLPHSVNIKEMDMETKSAILFTSKMFDPATYLSAVHPNATYHDLATGIANLQNSLEVRSEALRVLVEENFNNFVAVKTCTEGLEEDMRGRFLAEETDFGSKPLRDYLKQGVQKANQIFLPVLETASKADKLRATLGVFERSRFFFNLPSLIMESIDAGRYDVALRDYKKGKFMLENRPGQLLPIGAIRDDPTSIAEQRRQNRILNKVWGNVEKAMAEMKRVLLARLQESNRSVDEREKMLEILVEFQSSDDPLWAYFETQNTHIMNRMSSEHATAVVRVEEALRKNQSLDVSMQQELQNAVLLLQAKQDDGLLAKSVGEPVWKAILELVTSVSEVILSSLPSFWSIATSFIDGKFKRPSVIMRRSPSQCCTLALGIVKHYISLISQAFMLSEVVIMTSPGSTAASSRPPLLAVTSHSLSSAYYLQKIFVELQDCVNDINSLDISTDVSQGLKSMLESVKWRFIDVLASDWLRDANMFYYLESWIVNREAPSSTAYLSLFQHFQSHMNVAAYKIAADTELNLFPASFATNNAQRLRLSRQKSSAVSQIFLNKITTVFMDALYAFLDGLVFLASEESPIVKEADKLQKPRGTESAVEMRLHELLDLEDANVRLLLVLSNLKQVSTVVIPSMVAQLESAFGVSLSEDRETLKTVVGELDKTLFNEYIQPRTSILVQKVRDGVLGGQIDWYSAPQPTDVRPYVYDIMNYLVDLHAQVCNVAEGLLERTLNAVLDELSSEAVRCFTQVKRFGTGGLLATPKAVMELTFIQKSLGYYGKETAAGRKLEDLYTRQITVAYSPSAQDVDFNTSFQAIQKPLSEARKATTVQFLCFRQTNLKPDDPMGDVSSKGKEVERPRRKERGGGGFRPRNG